MGKTKVKESKKPLTLSKVVVYILLILLAITIIIPVGWVFVASVKQNSEFYGSPWVLPEKIYFQNFIDAWEKASMGTYMLNSVIVTALALLLLIVISLPAAYVLSRFKF
ncbi:MAG: carbohydrate ABC transporter permease, partial [Mediterraneibacter sp.]|nr:carbohydrate ABC transporter permease [Mediterraneibacter sp.]